MSHHFIQKKGKKLKAQQGEKECKFFAIGKCMFTAEKCKFAHTLPHKRNEDGLTIEERLLALMAKKDSIRQEEICLKKQAEQMKLEIEKKKKVEQDTQDEVLLKRWALDSPIPVFFSRQYKLGVFTADGWSFTTSTLPDGGGVSVALSREELLRSYPRHKHYQWTCPEGFQGVIDYFMSRAKRLDEISRMTPEEKTTLLIGRRLQILQDESKHLDLQLGTKFASILVETIIQESETLCAMKFLSKQLDERSFQQEFDFTPLRYYCIGGAPN